MSPLKHKDVKTIDDAFDMDRGCVLDFSDRTFAEFFEDEFDINIHVPLYQTNGTSKANKLRTFIKNEDPRLVAKVLRKLWEHKESLLKQKNVETSFVNSNAEATYQRVKKTLFDLISKIEMSCSVSKTDMLEQFGHDNVTVEKLIASIKRDIQAGKPAAALDRLHTYSMKFFAHLIEKHGDTCTRDVPLHSRVGKYIKLIENSYNLSKISKLCLKSSISIFDEFNNVRNNHSFAHDNPLLNEHESRYIFDMITALFEFINTIEGKKYGSNS